MPASTSVDESIAVQPAPEAAPTTEKRNVRRKPPRDWLHEREVEAMIAAAGRNRHAVRDKALILVCYRHELQVAKLVALEWAHQIPIPEPPLDAPQRLEERCALSFIIVCKAARELTEHGQAHGDVKSIQYVLARWCYLLGQHAHLLAAIGEEGDLLIGVDPTVTLVANS
jgi:integrase